MILCDTNILIEFYKGNPSVVQTLKTIGAANIAVSVITKRISGTQYARL